jgi:hypothetical protein
VKEYDSTWRYGILFTGGSWEVDCHCFSLTSSRPVTSVSASGMCYLRVILKIMECHKDKILSVTLFAIAINGMVNAVGPSVATSLYVDYISIYYSCRSIVTIERRLQGAIKLCHGGPWRMEFVSPQIIPNVYIWHAWALCTLTPPCFWSISLFQLFRRLCFWVPFLTANGHGNLTWDVYTSNANGH